MGAFDYTLGVYPIVRKDIAQAIKSLDKARKALAKGDSIIILPEGHRTLTGKIGAFKKGPFFLARQARADILPFSFSGFYRFNNKHSWHLNPGKMVARIGRPIYYDAYKKLSVDDLRTWCAIQSSISRKWIQPFRPWMLIILFFIEPKRSCYK